MTSRIAIFDSGVGGLSVLESIQKRLPACEYIYFADCENFPYGNKSEDTLRNCISEGAKKLFDRYAPDLLVVACNTASTTALENVRSHLPIPVVGVVPALKPAALMTKTRTIGLLATPATVKQKYTEQLIEDYCQGIHVIKVGSARLAEIAEYKLAGGTVNLEEVKTEIAPLFAEGNVDTVVLGCTHFPLLLEEFQAISSPRIRWIDSGDAIALRVQSLLDWEAKQEPSHTVCVTGKVPVRSGLVSTFRSYGFTTVERI